MQLRFLALVALATPTHSFLLATHRTPYQTKASAPPPRAAVSAGLGDNLRAAGAAALAAGVLFISPNAALAKGGGSHMSSSHSSSSHSSSSHSSSSHSSSSPRSSSSSRSSPGTYRASGMKSSSSSVPRSYNPSTSRPSTSRSGRSSSSRSRSRSRSRSSGSGSSGSGSHVEEEVHTTYRPRTTYRPTRRYDTVYYDSSPVVYDTPSYSAPVFPPSATDAAFHNGLWAGRVEGLAVAGGAYYLYSEFLREEEDEEDEDEGYWHERPSSHKAKELYDKELKATQALMGALMVEHAKTDPLVSAIHMPASGKYEGASAEDDGGDQGVMSQLTFKGDGTVEGWGEDAEDGRYVIKDGVWSTTGGDESTVRPGGRVAWVEVYDSGFEVALRGQVLADGTIRAMWASSIGVLGSVDLVKCQ